MILCSAEQRKEIEELVRIKVAPEEKWAAICRKFGINTVEDLYAMPQDSALRFITGMRKQEELEK